MTKRKTKFQIALTLLIFVSAFFLAWYVYELEEPKREEQLRVEKCASAQKELCYELGIRLNSQQDSLFTKTKDYSEYVTEIGKHIFAIIYEKQKKGENPIFNSLLQTCDLDVNISLIKKLMECDESILKGLEKSLEIDIKRTQLTQFRINLDSLVTDVESRVKSQILQSLVSNSISLEFSKEEKKFLNSVVSNAESLDVLAPEYFEVWRSISLLHEDNKKVKKKLKSQNEVLYYSFFIGIGSSLVATLFTFICFNLIPKSSFMQQFINQFKTLKNKK